jgi:hypothetical protein
MFVFLFLIVFLSVPARAEILDFNLDFRVEPINGGVIIRRDLDLQRRQTNEIIRGNDLKSAVKELVLRVKDFLRGLKARRMDQIRGTELTQISNQNAADTIRRNKVIQQMRKQQQRDQIQALKARNAALKERIRDLSRR